LREREGRDDEQRRKRCTETGIGWNLRRPEAGGLRANRCGVWLLLRAANRGLVPAAWACSSGQKPKLIGRFAAPPFTLEGAPI